MSRIRILLIALTLAAPAVAVTGCASDGSGGIDPGDLIDGTARLEVVGSTTRIVNEMAEEIIEIRYLDKDGAPIPNGLVEFLIEGDPNTGSLSGHASPTNDDGIAEVTLRAGTEATFDVVATAELAPDPVSVSITVQPLSFGTLDYVVTYAGRRVVDSAEVAIWTNMTCSDLQRAVPAPRETQVTSLRAHNSFEGVEIGLPLAVYALGIDNNDNVAAEACADATLSTQRGSLEIPLGDVAELFGGDYSVEETFDVTSGFSPALDTTLDILGGLSRDPAAYIVDFVAMDPRTPSWLRSALSSGPVRALIAGYLRDAISDIHVPSYITDLVDFGAGVNMAFSQLTLVGDLEFGEASEFGTYDGTHRVHALRFPLIDETTTERPIRAMAPVEVTVGPEIGLAEHTLAVSFGEVVEMVLHDVLLPRLPGSPATTTEFLGDLLDCDAIATSIAGTSGTWESVTNAVCEVGLTVLGEVIENYITDMWQYEQFTLSGHAELTDSDLDYDRDHLDHGHATVVWTGDSGELRFDGVMSGQRLDDHTGRTSPVRERMHELR